MGFNLVAIVADTKVDHQTAKFSYIVYQTTYHYLPSTSIKFLILIFLQTTLLTYHAINERPYRRKFLKGFADGRSLPLIFIALILADTCTHAHYMQFK